MYLYKFHGETMSADDWIKCPYCCKFSEDKIEELNRKLRDAENKLIAKDYFIFKEKSLSELKELENKFNYESVRVDGTTEYGFDSENNFFIDLSAYCETCGRDWIINTKVQANIKKLKQKEVSK